MKKMKNRKKVKKMKMRKKVNKTRMKSMKMRTRRGNKTNRWVQMKTIYKLEVNLKIVQKG